MRLPTAGDLDRLISIEHNVATRDPVYNSEVPDWQPLIAIPGSSPPEPEDMWAQKRDARASRGEIVRQGAEISTGRTTFTIRYPDVPVDSTMRVIDRESGELYQIVGPPSELGRRQFLELSCELHSTEGSA